MEERFRTRFDNGYLGIGWELVFLHVGDPSIREVDRSMVEFSFQGYSVDCLRTIESELRAYIELRRHDVMDCFDRITIAKHVAIADAVGRLRASKGDLYG